MVISQHCSRGVLLSTLVNKDPISAVIGIRDSAPILRKKQQIYENIDYEADDYKYDIGAKQMPHKENKTDLLMHIWHYPPLSIHGIEGTSKGNK